MGMNHVEPAKNSKAIISLVGGIVGWALLLLTFCFSSTFGALLTIGTLGLGLLCLLPLYCIPPIGWILAVIFGHLGLRQANQALGEGRGLAVAGLVLGYLGLGLIILGILVLVGTIIFGGSIPIILDQWMPQLY